MTQVTQEERIVCLRSEQVLTRFQCTPTINRLELGNSVLQGQSQNKSIQCQVVPIEYFCLCAWKVTWLEFNFLPQQPQNIAAFWMCVGHSLFILTPGWVSIPCQSCFQRASWSSPSLWHMCPVRWATPPTLRNSPLSLHHTQEWLPVPPGSS